MLSPNIVVIIHAVSSKYMLYEHSMFFLFQAFWQIFNSFEYTSAATTIVELEGFNAYNNNGENNDNTHEDIFLVAGYSYANVILVYL